MFPLEMPPQPPWEGLHPLVIHFPIGLLFVAPVFMLLAALLGKYGRWFGVTALLLLVMGTAGAFVSVQTGDAAYDVLEEIDDDGWEVVEQHQEAAKKVSQLYVWMTILYAVILAVPLLLWKLNSWKYWLPANLIALALLMVANIQLANAAHLGGRLVHQYGARAVLAEEEQAADEEEASAEEAESGDEAADDSSDAAMDDSEAVEDTAADTSAPAEEEASTEAETEAEPEMEAEKPAAEPAKETPAEEKATEPGPESEAAAKEEPAEAKETPAEEPAEGSAKEAPAEAEAKEAPEEPPAKEVPEEPPAKESPKEPPAEPSEAKKESGDG